MRLSFRLCISKFAVCSIQLHNGREPAMTMRTWLAAGISIGLAAGLSGADKPFGLPAVPLVEGKVPTRLTQDHFQQGLLVAPRLLPASILEPNPRHGPESAGISLADALASMELLSYAKHHSTPTHRVPSNSSRRAIAPACRRN
jgi:hypothetical protein